MADVAQKVKNANDIEFGDAIIKTGITETQKLDTTPQPATLPTVAQVENKYTDRFDDRSYYNV